MKKCLKISCEKKFFFGSLVPHVWDQWTTCAGLLNHLWETCNIQVQYSEFFQNQIFQHSLLQDFSLQRNLYNVSISNERM